MCESFLILSDADPETFIFIEKGIAKDKNQVYSFGIKTSANPKNCTKENLNGCL
jgi:hypothetical protein